VIEPKRGYGAPEPKALLAAALLHAVVLGLPLLPLRNGAPDRPREPRALPVSILFIPDEEPPPEDSVAEADAAAADEAAAAPPAPQEAAPASPPADAARAEPADEPAAALAAASANAPPAKPRSLPRPPAPKPEPPRAAESEAMAVAHAFVAGTAVYDVALGAGGGVAAVKLLQSSGTAAFDAAGETMIRTALGFDPPAQPTAFTVTIRFTPEGAATATPAPAE
jgi:TonB family protein